MRIDPNRVGAPSITTDLTQSRPEAVSPSLDVEVGARPVKSGSSSSSSSSSGSSSGSGANSQPELAELEQAVEKMNRAMRAFNLQTLQFEVTKSNRIVVTVIDTNTGEIIRQIPPEEMMDTFHRMEDVLGVLIDRRV